MTNEITKVNGNAIQNASDFEIPRGYICTLDISSISGKMQLATALNAAKSMRDLVNVPLSVENIVTTEGVRARTGEMCVNTYLFTSDGNVYFTQSEGIARAVKIIIGLFADPATGEFVSPASLGVGLKVEEQILANGNTLKTLVPVELPA